jgi:protein arginine kinase
MGSPAKILKKETWFEKSGSENDVIVSSRISLSRNLSNYPFPETLSTDEKKKVEQNIVQSFKDLLFDTKFTVFKENSITPEEKKTIEKRYIMDSENIDSKSNSYIIGDDGETSAVINDDDHLKLSCTKSGLALREAFETVNQLDNQLENSINYSVSNELGYLTSSLDRVGTGMKASILIHVPALVLTSLLTETLKIIKDKAFVVKPFGTEDSEPESSMFEIFNNVTIGFSESEIIDNMMELASSLMLLERKMRGIVYEKKRKKIEDKVFRSLGLLKFSRSISFDEALRLISYVRLGICLNIINDYTLEKITSLFFIVNSTKLEQPASDKLPLVDETIDPLDFLRAQEIRALLVK